MTGEHPGVGRDSGVGRLSLVRPCSGEGSEPVGEGFRPGTPESGTLGSGRWEWTLARRHVSHRKVPSTLEICPKIRLLVGW